MDYILNHLKELKSQAEWDLSTNQSHREEIIQQFNLDITMVSNNIEYIENELNQISLAITMIEGPK